MTSKSSVLGNKAVNIQYFVPVFNRFKDTKGTINLEVSSQLNADVSKDCGIEVVRANNGFYIKIRKCTCANLLRNAKKKKFKFNTKKYKK